MAYERKEAHAIERVAEIIRQLDVICGRIEAADRWVKHFHEQERAIQAIRLLIREVKIADQIYDKQEYAIEKTVNPEFEKEGEALSEIAAYLDGIEIGRDDQHGGAFDVKSLAERRKALHEVKRVLHYLGRYDKYNEKEMENVLASANGK